MVSRDERIMGSMWGTFAGDALCLGSHWHYDLPKRDTDIYPGGVSGFDNPVVGHYHEGRERGDFTHYGDAAMVLLVSMRRHRGFSVAAYAEEFANYFSLYAGYLDKATKTALDNAASGCHSPAFGGPDDQTGGISRNGLVAVMSDPDHLAARMTAVCKITQNNYRAIDAHRFHGFMLHALLDGMPMREAMAIALDDTASEFIQTAFDAALGKLSSEIGEATGDFGRACSLHQTLPSIMHAVMRLGHDPKACLFEIMAAGGDNAARAMVAGSWLGAAHGLHALPQDWLDQLAAKDELKVMIEDVAGLASRG